jgi:molybdopterin-guanine dinucleotide biosynthesis protein A
MTGVFGAVLCGGASSRMGVDKATLPVDGVAMARRVADALAAAGCSPVSAIGGDPDELSRLGLEHIVDQYPGDGPLGGVLTALALQAPAAVMACDLPGLRAETVTSLLDALGEHDAAIAFSDRAEPLCAVWSDRAAPVLRARFQAGERAMHRAIDGLDIAWVTVAATDLHNVNAPGDLGNL